MIETTEMKVGDCEEVCRKTWGTMTHIMYLIRESESEFIVRPKWEGSAVFHLEDPQTFPTEERARSWAETFV